MIQAAAVEGDVAGVMAHELSHVMTIACINRVGGLTEDPFSDPPPRPTQCPPLSSSILLCGRAAHALNGRDDR